MNGIEYFVDFEEAVKWVTQQVTREPCVLTRVARSPLQARAVTGEYSGNTYGFIQRDRDDRKFVARLNMRYFGE